MHEHVIILFVCFVCSLLWVINECQSMLQLRWQWFADSKRLPTGSVHCVESATSDLFVCVDDVWSAKTIDKVFGTHDIERITESGWRYAKAKSKHDLRWWVIYTSCFEQCKNHCMGGEKGKSICPFRIYKPSATSCKTVLMGQPHWFWFILFPAWYRDWE